MLIILSLVQNRVVISGVRFYKFQFDYVKAGLPCNFFCHTARVSAPGIKYYEGFSLARSGVFSCYNFSCGYNSSYAVVRIADKTQAHVVCPVPLRKGCSVCTAEIFSKVVPATSTVNAAASFAYPRRICNASTRKACRSRIVAVVVKAPFSYVSVNVIKSILIWRKTSYVNSLCPVGARASF